MAEFTPATENFEERVRASFSRQGLMRTLGAEMHAVRPGHCEIHLPFDERLTQQHGFFHGGGLAAVIDTAGGYAALTLFGDDDGILTVEFKVNMVAPAEGERLIARGDVVKPGRTLTVTRGEVVAVKDGEEKICAVMQQTLMRITDWQGVKD